MQNKLFQFLLLLLIAFPGYGQNFGGNPNSLHWQQINTASGRVIFPQGLDSQAKRIHAMITLLDTTTLSTIGNQSKKWNVLLLNQTTIPNAYVRMAPIMSELNMTPAQDNFSVGSIRWDDNLIIHENRHMQQFANFNNGFTKVFSFLFGQEGQLLANALVIPDYFFEGDAVWQETLVSKQGRGRMPSFFNGYKSLWKDRKNYSWMKLRSGSMLNYVPDHYELGYPLVSYGYEKYGADFWKKVTTDATKFKGLFYSFNRSIAKHAGVPYQQFTKEAMAHFEQSFDLNETITPQYLTGMPKRNVVNYQFPHFVNDDTIVVSRSSYRELPGFYLLTGGKEKRIRVKDYVLDDYFSYRNGKIVYASYMTDARWGNRDYSVIKVLDIYSGQQQQLSLQTKYFSPDINAQGTEVICVWAKPDGSNQLVKLNAFSGDIIQTVPNAENYFFTQTKFLSETHAISAVRNPAGKMALVKVQLDNGFVQPITSFTDRLIGYPFVKGDKVYFSMLDVNGKKIADKLFLVEMSTGKVFRVTDNVNGIYHPVVNNRGEMVAAAFTSNGYRLQTFKVNDLIATPIQLTDEALPVIGAQVALQQKGNGALFQVIPTNTPLTAYKKSSGLFNFHSLRPYVDDPEWGVQVFGDNLLSSLHHELSYTFNRNEQSSTVAYDVNYGGSFTRLNSGVSYSYNRNIDTAVGRGINFNSAKVYAGISLPFAFVAGRTSKYLTLAYNYNIEQIPYIGIGKNVLDNFALKYSSFLFSFSNVSQQAKQHILPRYAQTIAVTYRKAYTWGSSHKWVGAASLYWPGLMKSHNFVINGSFQTRDTLNDVFSNTFSYSRGYLGLSTRRMLKYGINYHFPIGYPDWGIGNMVYIQRVRANVFYDYTQARARLFGLLTKIVNRSVGAEFYLDTKLWNALPASLGVRYSYLLDTDLRNPLATNRWEIILPINLIPN